MKQPMTTDSLIEQVELLLPKATMRSEVAGLYQALATAHVAKQTSRLADATELCANTVKEQWAEYLRVANLNVGKQPLTPDEAVAAKQQPSDDPDYRLAMYERHRTRRAKD